MPARSSALINRLGSKASTVCWLFTSSFIVTLGNHCRKLLTGEGPTILTAFLGDDHKHYQYKKLLSLFGDLQTYAKAALLTDEEITRYPGLAYAIFKQYKVNNRDYKTDPI